VSDATPAIVRAPWRTAPARPRPDRGLTVDLRGRVDLAGKTGDSTVSRTWVLLPENRPPVARAELAQALRRSYRSASMPPGTVLV
jgi:hypothetical protein